MSSDNLMNLEVTVMNISFLLSTDNILKLYFMPLFPSDAVFNLTNNVDLDNTKKKMEIYQKENKDVIQKNKLKLVGFLSISFFLGVKFMKNLVRI